MSAHSKSSQSIGSLTWYCGCGLLANGVVSPSIVKVDLRNEKQHETFAKATQYQRKPVWSLDENQVPVRFMYVYIMKPIIIINLSGCVLLAIFSCTLESGPCQVVSTGRSSAHLFAKSAK